MFWQNIVQSVGILLLYAAPFVLWERLQPAEPQRLRAMGFNVLYFFSAYALGVWLSTLLIAWLLVHVTPLRPGVHTMLLELGLFGKAMFALIYFLVFDFFYYWFHRAQHALPLLWREHLLHHSDETLNVSTTFRQHWLEEPIKVFFISLPMAFLFADRPALAGLAAIMVSGWVFFIHANLRLPLGPLSAWISGPQLHRIHHSRLPQHRDKNFAVFFPLWDRLFGTYYAPGRDEYPVTGLSGGGQVNDLLTAHLATFGYPVRVPVKESIALEAEANSARKGSS